MYFIVGILLLSLVAAEEGHMKLLAVRETADGYGGSIADVYLRIEPGSGQVFLDTFPLTRTDTQISTRFAKQIACDYLDEYCGQYDFFYTIRADSSIIAGPSAGAALSLLTISLLDGVTLDESVSITGTINSGGLIGFVGGIKAKIQAAADIGLTTVLIPQGERFVDDDKVNGSFFSVDTESNSSNATIDLVAFGLSLGVEVIEVSDLDEALAHFTGKEYVALNVTLTVDEHYAETMSHLTAALCNRTIQLGSLLEGYNLSRENSTHQRILNLSAASESAFSEGNYYSAASYCFSANVQSSYLIKLLKDAGEEDVNATLETIERNVERLEQALAGREQKTLSDLEAYSVVVERLIDAKEQKDRIDLEDPNLRTLAFSLERVYSAFSWARFYDHRGKTISINSKSLRSSCEQNIAEAEERFQYLQLFYPVIDLADTRSELNRAYDDLNSGEYTLCLFKATKAKAESNIVLNSIGVEVDKIPDLIAKKRVLAKRVIARQIEKGNFPILGYSYYEYSGALIDSDPFSALLFAEYALEMSNLDMYFPPGKGIAVSVDVDSVAIFLWGLVLGAFIMRIVTLLDGNGRKKKK